MPQYWGLSAKEKDFVIVPKGSHPRMESIPIQVVVRDILKFANTRKEAKKILSQGKILVDRKERKDGRFAVGLMDVIEIPDMGKAFRVEASRKGLVLKETEKPEEKTCRIIGKTILRGGVEQINLHDGRNIRVGKKSPYRRLDSLVISLPDQKIINHIPLKVGSRAVIIGGKNRGLSGTIASVSERKFMLEKATITLETGGKKSETLKEYIFPIGVTERKTREIQDTPKQKSRKKAADTEESK